MPQIELRNPPKEALDALFAACIAVGLIAGVVIGFRLYNSLTSS